MRYAIIVLILAACGPSDADIARARSDRAVGAIRAETFRIRLDSAMADAPTDDSARRILRGPLADSVAHYLRMQEDAEAMLR